MKLQATEMSSIMANAAGVSERVFALIPTRDARRFQSPWKAAICDVIDQEGSFDTLVRVEVSDKQRSALCLSSPVEILFLKGSDVN